MAKKTARRSLAAARVTGQRPAPQSGARKTSRPRVVGPNQSRTTARPAAPAPAPAARPVARPRVSGAEAAASRAAARPAQVPRHSGDRRPTEVEIQQAEQTLQRAQRTGPSRVKVQAKKMGFYDHKRRRKGDVFSLKDPKHFTRKWMVKVDQSTPERITTGREELKRQHDEILGARFEGRSPATESMEVQEEDVDNPLED